MEQTIIFSEYEKRCNEINCMLNFVKELDNQPEVDEDEASALNIQKASLIIMLYNLVESTVSLNFMTIFDNIIDNNIGYTEVSPQLRDIWLELNYNDMFDKSSSFQSYLNRTSELINNITNNNNQNILLFSESKVEWQLPGGNLAARSITKLCKKFGITLNIPSEVNSKAGILEDIKNKRNSLGHGDKSFCEIGTSVTIKDIESWFKEVTDYLNHFTEQISEYVSNKGYCNKNVVD
ncbi:MAE_28990/MAE_18760 family HEPN-like nuclease [Pediococcus acidilactici]|uniref:MAE_28990/MAE_18760 family HEPN-like nuclease n=1 Tax=Pediococcus acidilactici TaxID=1254 RepID=A0AAW8YME1_PEDAC|nr:MAE_28990/MAE_18760 family HEPN-like nuclease [Pediococcus acidilactici]MDV2911068.1 MAE_28990/MAE_18760 family HEPN-like nuclease [Pediococcus acidilactici]WQS17608.1 MAE_28990/MAE_18760 family HEPN-like nuclease [Pediococcus acidilactici]